MLLAVVAVAFSVNTVFGMGRDIAGQEAFNVTPDQIFVYFPHPKFFEIANTDEKFEDNETIFPYGTKFITNDDKIVIAEDLVRAKFRRNFKLLSQSMYTTQDILYPAGKIPLGVNHAGNFIVLYPELSIYDIPSSYFGIKQSLELRGIIEKNREVIGQVMRERRLVPLEEVRSQGGYWKYAKNVLNVRGEWCFSDAVIPDLCDVKKSFKQGTKDAFLQYIDESVREALDYSYYNPKSKSQAQLCRVKIDKDEKDKPNGACLIMADDDMDFGRGFLKKARGVDGQEIDLTEGEHVFIVLDRSGSMSDFRADNCFKMLDRTLRKLLAIIAEKRPGTPFRVHVAMFNNRVTAIPELQNVLIANEEDVKQFMQRVRDNYCAENRTAMYAAVNRQVSGLLEYGDGTTTKLDNVTCIIVGDGEETERNVSKDTMLQSLRSFIKRDGSVFILGVGEFGDSMSETFASLDGEFPEHRFSRESYTDEAFGDGEADDDLQDRYFSRF